MAGAQISTSVTIIDNQKGYNAINVSGLDTSSSPSILAGSVVEVASSFFSFTLDETPSTLSVLADENPAYLYLTPSGTAGSQILTPAWGQIAPTWVASKNGWYLSAGSNIRAVIGCLYDSGNYYDKQVMINQATTGVSNYFRGATYGIYTQTQLGQYCIYAKGATFGDAVKAVGATSNSGGVDSSGTAYGTQGSASGTTGSGIIGYASGVSGYGVKGSGPATSYDFYAAGAGTNYGPFTGGHEVKLSKGEYKKGQIVVCTGDTEKRDDSISSTLPTIELCKKENDSAVFGVFNSEVDLPKDHWYNKKAGEKFATCNALGEGRVLVTDVNGELKLGDYITTSKIKGFGQKQNDDILHNYTLGKVTEKVDWDNVPVGKTGYKEYLIACVYVSA